MAAQTLTLPSRPLRSLLLLLPLLNAQPGSKVTYEMVDRALLVQLAEDAEAVIGTVQHAHRVRMPARRRRRRQ